MAMIRYGLAGAAVILVLGMHALTNSTAAPSAATGSPTPMGGRGTLQPLGLIDTFGCGPGISFWQTPPPPQVLPPGGSLAFRTLIGLPVAGRAVVEGQFLLDLTHASLATYFVAAQPGVAIIVAAKPPTGRTLAVIRRGHSVYLAGYPASLPPAVGEEATAFVEPPTGACLPGGTPRWRPLRGGSLHDDGCRPDEHQER